jgi:hypothetical protein
VVKAHLRHAQEEVEQDTQTLKKVQGNIVEQHRIAEHEKVSLHAKFDEEKAQMHQEKENLLTGQLKVKESVNRALHFVIGLEPQAKDPIEHQVE